MTTRKKMAIGGAIVAGLTVYLAYRGASATWQYYLTADECLAERASLMGRRLRVSGRIAAGTLALERDRSRASFALEADGANLEVVCSGPVPDNLDEGIAVLVEGRLDASGLLRGDKVLTRCAGKYESRVPAAAAQPRTAVPCPIDPQRSKATRLAAASTRRGVGSDAAWTRRLNRCCIIFPRANNVAAKPEDTP